MQIRVLGCSGAIAAGSRTTAFLLDSDVLIDAGTGVGDLTLEQLVQIDDILISHSHLDHVLGVPLLADSVMRRRKGKPPIRVHALPATLDALRTHLFNGVIWPDFTRLPTAEHPILELCALAIGQVLRLGGRQIEVLPARHTVPAVGFAVLAPAGAWVYTGDTGPNPALWQRLRGLQVHHLVIETAFGDDEQGVAHVSGHLHPAALARELAHWQQLQTRQAAQHRPAQIHITHIKPGELEAVMADIHRLGLGLQPSALQAGQLMSLD